MKKKNKKMLYNYKKSIKIVTKKPIRTKRQRFRLLRLNKGEIIKVLVLMSATYAKVWGKAGISGMTDISIIVIHNSASFRQAMNDLIKVKARYDIVVVSPAHGSLPKHNNGTPFVQWTNAPEWHQTIGILKSVFGLTNYIHLSTCNQGQFPLMTEFMDKELPELKITAYTGEIGGIHGDINAIERWQWEYITNGCPVSVHPCAHLKYFNNKIY